MTTILLVVIFMFELSSLNDAKRLDSSKCGLFMTFRKNVKSILYLRHISTRKKIEDSII